MSQDSRSLLIVGAGIAGLSAGIYAARSGYRVTILAKHALHGGPKHYDLEAAPPGKSAVTAFLESGYDFWRPLAADNDAYRNEKQACADLVIAALDRELPGAADAVEVADVSTPLTRERYTGSWMGAMQARRPDASLIGALLRRGPRTTIPRWTASGWPASGWRPGAASRQPRSRGGTRRARSAARTARASPADAPRTAPAASVSGPAGRRR